MEYLDNLFNKYTIILDGSSLIHPCVNHFFEKIFPRFLELSKSKIIIPYKILNKLIPYSELDNYTRDLINDYDRFNFIDVSRDIVINDIFQMESLNISLNKDLCIITQDEKFAEYLQKLVASQVLSNKNIKILFIGRDKNNAINLYDWNCWKKSFERKISKKSKIDYSILRKENNNNRNVSKKLVLFLNIIFYSLILLNLILFLTKERIIELPQELSIIRTIAVNNLFLPLLALFFLILKTIYLRSKTIFPFVTTLVFGFILTFGLLTYNIINVKNELNDAKLVSNQNEFLLKEMDKNLKKKEKDNKSLKDKKQQREKENQALTEEIKKIRKQISEQRICQDALKTVQNSNNYEEATKPDGCLDTFIKSCVLEIKTTIDLNPLPNCQNIKDIVYINNKIYEDKKDKNWYYIPGPKDDLYFTPAKKTIALKFTNNEQKTVGNCKDFAIVMAGCIRQLGFRARIKHGYCKIANCGHAWCEVLIGNYKNKCDIENCWKHEQNNYNFKLDIKPDSNNEYWMSVDWNGKPDQDCQNSLEVAWTSE